jgi:hypothetical protein
MSEEFMKQSTLSSLILCPFFVAGVYIPLHNYKHKFDEKTRPEVTAVLDLGIYRFFKQKSNVPTTQ